MHAYYRCSETIMQLPIACAHTHAHTGEYKNYTEVEGGVEVCKVRTDTCSSGRVKGSNCTLSVPVPLYNVVGVSMAPRTAVATMAAV